MEKVVGLEDVSTSSRTGVITWPTQEDGEGNVVVDIVNLPILADAANLFNSLRDAASYWRSQEKKALWLKLPIDYCKNFLPPAAAVEVGFKVHELCLTYMMLVLSLRDDESCSLPIHAVDQFKGGLHFSSNDMLEMNAEQYRSSLRHSSMLPQWQSRGHMNPEAAESAEHNASIHPLELAVNLAPAGMIDVGSNSQADAVRRCMERSHQQPGSDNYEGRVRTTKRRSHSSQHNSAQKTKRIRGPNWTHDQKLYLLKHMLDYKSRQKHAEGEPGDWFRSASRSYFDEYGIMMEPEKWQRQMDSLVKQFKAIRTYEWEIQSGERTSVSYWKLSEDARQAAHKSLKNLPLSFDQDMFQLMENIHQIQKKNKQRGSRGRQVQVQQSSSNLLMDSTISESAGPSNGNRSSHHVLQCSNIGSLEGTEGDTLGRDVGVMFPRSTASMIDVEELIAKISPLVTSMIEDAFQPLRSAMQKREEDEKNFRTKMLSTQAQQLAVVRQELELTRSNNVFANAYGVPIGGVDSNVDPISEHGEDVLRSYFAEEEPDEGFANFDWTNNPL